jgi:hypothetical protein
MLELETLGLDHFERFVNRGSIAPEGSIVGESNGAFGVDDDGRRPIYVLGMHSKRHWIDAVACAYFACRVAQVRPPDTLPVLLLKGLFGKPVLGINFFAHHQSAAVEVMTLNRSDRCIRCHEVFFHTDEVIELGVTD